MLEGVLADLKNMEMRLYFDDQDYVKMGVAIFAGLFLALIASAFVMKKL
jgi:hypothetical protein